MKGKEAFDDYMRGEEGTYTQFRTRGMRIPRMGFTPVSAGMNFLRPLRSKSFLAVSALTLSLAGGILYEQNEINNLRTEIKSMEVKQKEDESKLLLLPAIEHKLFDGKG